MKLGILVPGAEATPSRLRELKSVGFETVSLFFWEQVDPLDWDGLADSLQAVDWRVSSLSLYGNPLGGSKSLATSQGWETLLREAPRLGAPLVSGFAGRIPGVPVPESIAPWKEFFAPLLDRADAAGLRVAFETCRMGGNWKTGTWNIAYCPAAWELMEETLPGRWDLEWEPGHAVLSHADPLSQIAGWEARVAHLHGKDARIDQAALARHGAFGGMPLGNYTLPGQGDSDWGKILGYFAALHFEGSLDIEVPNPNQTALSDLEKAFRFLSHLRP